MAGTAPPTTSAAADAQLAELFALADADHDGRLNARQVHDVLQRLGLLLTEREKRELGYSMDRRYYGLVSLPEFHEVLRDVAGRVPTVSDARGEIARSLRAYNALPLSVGDGDRRAAAAVAGAAAGVTDATALRRLLTRTGDCLSSAEVDTALRVAQAAGAVVGATIDTDALVGALVAAAVAAASR